MNSTDLNCAETLQKIAKSKKRKRIEMEGEDYLKENLDSKSVKKLKLMVDKND